MPSHSNARENLLQQQHLVSLASFATCQFVEIHTGCCRVAACVLAVPSHRVIPNRIIAIEQYSNLLTKYVVYDQTRVASLR